MAVVRCKGTTFKVTIATVLTPLAQIISMDFGPIKMETVECDTLDNTSPGIPKMNTGRVDGGKVSGELYFDPALAGHVSYVGLVEAPPTTTMACAIVFANSPASTMLYNAVGFSLSGTIGLKDGLKGKFDMEISGLPTFSTAS